MSGEVHSSLIHHAVRKVGGIGRVVRGEYTQELVPAGDQAVVVADVREELERRRRGRDGGEDAVRCGGNAESGLLPTGVAAAGRAEPGLIVVRPAPWPRGEIGRASCRGVR